MARTESAPSSALSVGNTGSGMAAPSTRRVELQSEGSEGLWQP